MTRKSIALVFFAAGVVAALVFVLTRDPDSRPVDDAGGDAGAGPEVVARAPAATPAETRAEDVAQNAAAAAGDIQGPTGQPAIADVEDFSFTAMVSTAELLTSPVLAMEPLGEEALRRHGDDMIRILLGAVERGTLGEKFLASRLLRVFVSPWSRYVEAQYYNRWASGRIRRPLDRAVDHPRAEEIRNVAEDTLGSLIENPQSAPVADKPGAPEALDQQYVQALWGVGLTLAEVGNDTSLARCVTWLAREKSPELDGMLMRIIEFLHGAAPFFVQGDPGFTCGFPDVAHAEKYAAEERIRFAKAKEELLTWHADVIGRPRRDRVRAAFVRWRGHFVNRGMYDPLPRMEEIVPLLRLGTAVVPLLQEAKAETTLVARQAAFEYARTFITGDADMRLVRSLYARLWNPALVAAASDIVAVSTSREGREFMAKKLRSPVFRGIAIRALVSGPPSEALPVLKAMLASDPLLQPKIQTLESLLSRAESWRERGVSYDALLGF